jgi:imidazolonepropionase-like amidohydrolase
VPGLVDMHTHPGAEEPGQPFDEAMFERHVRSHRDAGVLTIRCPGLVELLPLRLHQIPSPHILAAGPWLGAPGGFFEGWGQQMAVEDLPAAAEEQISHTDGWCKVVADWITTEEGQRRYGPTIPPDVLHEIVTRVHAVGGRVAVHSQHPDGAEAAVMAGADSIEHGMHMSEDLLDRMASQGTALVPTMTAFSTIPEAVQAKAAPDDFSRFMLAGWERHPSLVRAAWEAGVTVLAGTDDLPHGNVLAEVEQLIDAGIPVDAALGAASWLALDYLGLPYLRDGTRADLITYRSDPRVADGFRRPERIIAGGTLIA